MSDEQTAPVAAGSEGPSTLSLDDAVALMSRKEEDRREDDKPDPKAEAKGEAEPTSDEPEGDEPSEAGDEPDSPADKAEPEPDEDPDEDYVHGNAKTRLRDGTVVAVADLKRDREELQELRAKAPDLDAKRKEIEATTAQLQQRQKDLDTLLPHALRVAQAAIPPEPDKGTLESDPIEYYQRQVRRAEAIAEFRQFDEAHKAQVAEQQKKAEQEQATYVAEQQRQLFQKMPDLKDKAKAQSFYQDMTAEAGHYGISKDELDQAYDHRLILILKDSAELRKLRAARPKVEEKAKGAIPVQQAGRRTGTAERRDSETSDLSKRLSRTGDLDDAVALVNKLNL